jgi:hypothetical protein
LRSARDDTFQPAELPGKWIALVAQVEFDPFRKEYGGASARAALPVCKSECRALEQKQPARLPFGVAGKPEPVLVAPDEKRRDGLVEDAGIKRLK